MLTHEPVLLNEALNGLNIQPDGIYIDATFGRGGHSRAILSKLSAKGRLIAFDKDPAALAYAHEEFARETRFSIYHGSFTGMKTIADNLGIIGKINGILFDLGVSSPQLDAPERGFSFMRSGPLDMRMDTTGQMSAATFINTASQETLRTVFKEYGEERFSGRIATAIVEARANRVIETTDHLAEIVKQAHPKWEKHKHPATRVFQAIRIYINKELEDLQEGLECALTLLQERGRLVVISFHSLEDRMVKQFMREKSQGPQLPKGLPIRQSDLNLNFKCVGRAIKPTQEEMVRNVRARSAVMRIGEKLT